MKIFRKLKDIIPKVWKEKSLYTISVILYPFLKKEIENAKNDLFMTNESFKRRLAREWIRNKYYSSEDSDKREININKFWSGKAGYNWHKNKTLKYKNNPNNLTFLKWRKKACKALKEILENKKNYDVIYEIGSGNGLFIDYLSQYIESCSHFVGVDLSEEMIKECKVSYSKNKNISFFSGEIMDCLNSAEFQELQKESVNIITYGTLEYFQFLDIKILLSELKRKYKKILFTLIEPINIDLNKQKISERRGSNFAFSHNYPIIFNEAEFNILWQNLENVDKNNPKYNFISMIAEFDNA